MFQRLSFFIIFFFFNDTATTEIYTLSLHDALPISPPRKTSMPTSTRSPSCSSAKRSEEHTSELQSRLQLVCRLLLEKKNKRRDDVALLLNEETNRIMARVTSGTLRLHHVSSVLAFEADLPDTGYARVAFFFNDPATTEIYTLSLHDALPI